MLFFTADEHYHHHNIIKYCKRPFGSVREMNEALISNHNEVVGPEDRVVHVGDFTLKSQARAREIVSRLNGRHTFLKGSHDYWLGRKAQTTWERKIGDNYVVACHYAMRAWARSHYNSWMLYGHSHGTLEPVGKQWDVGVDNNGFYPVSIRKLAGIMKGRPDNPNLVKDRRR